MKIFNMSIQPFCQYQSVNRDGHFENLVTSTKTNISDLRQNFYFPEPAQNTRRNPMACICFSETLKKQLIRCFETYRNNVKVLTKLNCHSLFAHIFYTRVDQKVIKLALYIWSGNVYYTPGIYEVYRGYIVFSSPEPKALR